MKTITKLLSLLPLLGAAVCFSAPSASAQESQPPAKFRVGLGVDVGAPSGAVAEIQLHFWQDWLTLSPGITYNALNLGGRLALKLDPMALDKQLPVGLYVEEQLGFAANGRIPGQVGASLGYDYSNTYLGLRLGKPNKFNWNFKVGPSWMHVNGDLGSLVNVSSAGVSIGNPQANLWVLPTFETGFNFTF